MKKVLKNSLPIIGVLICSIIIIFISKYIFKGGFFADPYGEAMEYHKGTVVKILSESINSDNYIDDIEIGNQEVVVRMDDGPYKDNNVKIDHTISRYHNYKAEVGDKVVVGYYPNDTKITMGIYSYNRSNNLYLLAFIFIISVIIIGGIKGVKSLVALIFTLTCCIFLLIPLMIKGVSPVGTSIFIAILSTIVTLLLVSGFNIKTISAIIGTTLGICISGGLTYIFGNSSNLSGVNISEAENIFFIAERTGLKMHGILFAGILIASLGAIMDVAMSISSSINEIYSHNSNLSINKLFLSGMNIGKDIIGTMTNTLILAFTGGSIGVLLLVFSYYMPYIKLINLDLLGTEILQGLTGSIGIVLSVPTTALVSSYLCKKYSKPLK